MKKKMLAVITAIVITGGIGYDAYAKMDAGCYYKERNCWWNSNTKCSGSGSECGLASDC